MKINMDKLFTALVFFTLTISVFALRKTPTQPSNTNQTTEDGKYSVNDQGRNDIVEKGSTLSYGGFGGKFFEWVIWDKPNL